MIKFVGEVHGAEVLNRAFNRVEEHISDLRPVWPAVAAEFYAIEEEQFESEGAHGASGKWKPLSPAYKKWKELNHPGESILKLFHPLYESLTRHDAPDSIYRLDPQEMTLGSKTPYASVHQRTRPPISLTEADKRRLQKAIQQGLVPFIRRQGFQLLDERAA